MCFIPLQVINRWNSSDVKVGALSEINCSGIPYLAYMVIKMSIIVVAVILVVRIISTHLEWASTATSWNLERGQHNQCALFSMVCQATAMDVDEFSMGHVA